MKTTRTSAATAVPAPIVPNWVAARPLPPLTVPTPGDWVGKRLVDVYRWTREPDVVQQTTRATATVAPLDAGPALVWAGRSFEDAVVQAGGRAKQLGGIAQGVLQAADGSFYLTHLAHDLKPRTRQTSRHYDSIDGQDAKMWGEIVPVPVHNDVKAVVGESTWFDFRNGVSPAGRKAPGRTGSPTNRPQVAPQPLPGQAPSTPAGMPRNVASLSFVGGRWKIPVSYGANPTVATDTPGETWLWAGKSLEAAVAQASARARAENGIAQGIVKSADGSFYLTRLGYVFRHGLADIHGYNYIDADWIAENKFAGVRAATSNPVVQAIVGAQSWIPLSTSAASLH